MFGLSNKTMEKIATKVSVGIGLFLTLFTIFMIINGGLLGRDFYNSSIAKYMSLFMSFVGILFIVLLAGVFISAMLNVSRIANAIEEIKDKLNEK